MEPDYNYWCKFDSWSWKDCALLLNGIDPLYFKDLVFNTKETPKQAALKDAYKTFLLLKNIIKYDSHLKFSQIIHPYEIYIIAVRKNIPIPAKLSEFLAERYRQEKNLKQSNKKNIFKSSKHEQVFSASEKELTSRERHNLLKSLGIMAILLMEDSKYSQEFNLNNRPNAYQIAEAVLTKAQALGVPTEGLKSLDRKLKEALMMLIDEEM